MGRLWMFFLGGLGGKRKHRAGSTGSVAGRRALSNSPIYVIYYMLNSGGFTTACLQTITKGVLDLDDLGNARSQFKLRQPVDLFHTLKTVKGFLHLHHGLHGTVGTPRTPRNSGYGVFCTCGLSYNLFLLYV